ncbi:CTLH/CRA C-terminal to lish motif domain-containing protein [Phakopsora pachyrhizi]|uniref:CTLH/CRA C-terminal to lish motif domain-domain-containing protein n=1 Tax=Phakopsora pachyrhizi TaxID=170000 RepID=A0AAV0ARD5_PHAPC|nr:CTLH/CRA C-terminal to lish motif domain-containing protein [Phakopsora pachyrhizi]CAH7670169.1 CTLH/CRA C-terminal to lish motif domain-domain-containing protein [Phakopsora pachyrhizi]
MSGVTSRTNASSKPHITISRDDWEQRLADMHVDREDLNRLVMDYLVIEGFKDSAYHFARESGLTPTIDLDSIEYRMGIKNAIQRGDVDEAIIKVNDLNPEILDRNPGLLFHLQQQRMIEYVRNGQITEALVFAQQELAPHGEENPVFLSELERTMALLAFDATLIPSSSSGSANMSNSPPQHIRELLLPAQRQRTAGELNSAILTSQSHGKNPKLPILLRMMSWGESLLCARADFPKLDLANLLTPTNVSVSNQPEELTISVPSPLSQPPLLGSRREENQFLMG